VLEWAHYCCFNLCCSFFFCSGLAKKALAELMSDDGIPIKIGQSLTAGWGPNHLPLPSRHTIAQWNRLCMFAVVGAAVMYLC
jgi:hypothetical protein